MNNDWLIEAVNKCMNDMNDILDINATDKYLEIVGERLTFEIERWRFYPDGTSEKIGNGWN